MQLAIKETGEGYRDVTIGYNRYIFDSMSDRCIAFEGYSLNEFYRITSVGSFNDLTFDLVPDSEFNTIVMEKEDGS